MKKRKYHITVYLAYVFLFPLYIFGILAKFYDRKLKKNNTKLNSNLREKEDFHF